MDGGGTRAPGSGSQNTAGDVRLEQWMGCARGLLGTMDPRFGGRRLPPLDSARAESLLASLLLHRDAPQPRQRMAFLLWPDSTERQAQTNLRKVLYTLRHALPDTE